MAARGYLGKISAVVAINTGSVAPSLRASAKEIDSWANKTQRRISGAATAAGNALDGIFSPLQKLQAALKAANRAPLKGLLEIPNINGISQLSRAAESLFKPLGQAQKSFGNLSSEVQSAFLPAIKRAQAEAVRLAAEYDRTGDIAQDSFSRAKREIDKVIASEKRLAQAQQLARQGFSGRELQFAAPRAAAALTAAAAASQRAGDASGSALSDGRIAERVRQLQQVRDQIARQLARVEEIRQRPSVSAATAGGVTPQVLAAAERGLDRLSAKAEAATRKLNELLNRSTRAQSLTFALTGRPQDLAQAEAAYSGLVARAKELSAAQRSAVTPNLRSLNRLLGTGDESKLKDIRQLIVLIERELAKQQKLKIATEEADRKIKDIRAQLKSVSEVLSGSVSDPFERLRQSADKAKSAIDKVSDAKRKASLEGRLGAIQAGIAADAGNTSLTAAQQAAAARRRAAQLDRLAATAGTQTSADIFGPMLGSSGQKIEALKSQVTSLQSAIAALPRPLQAQLLPQLRAARDAFARLTPTSTAAEIRAAAKAASELEKNFKKASAAAQFRGTFGQFLRDGAVERYAAQLKSVQSQLLAVGVTAKGPVASAVDQYQRALERAARAGTLGTDRVKKSLDRYIDRIAAAAVSTGKFTEAQAKAFAANARGAFVRGDIGRGGVDRLQLGLQQLAFAVDDFFSVTGGFEQRVRAIGNNLTQLGFIVGGTTGLWVTLGAVIGLQGVSALYKWIKAGVSTEDELKALNDALSRQKSLVEELAQAFESLGDSIGRRAFSAAGQQARTFAKELERLSRRQKELRESRVSNLDDQVQAERGQQQKLERQLENATDGGQRVAILREIEASRQRERAAARAAAARPAASAEDVRNSVLGSIRATEFLEGGRLTRRSRLQAEARQAAAGADLAAAGADPAALARVLEQRISERQQVASQNITLTNLLGGDATEILRAREDVVNLGRALESLRLPANAKIDESIRALFKAAENASAGLEDAQKKAEEAFRAGIPGALQLQSTLDALATEIDKSLSAIAQAQKDFAEGRISSGERDSIIERERERVRRGRAARERAVDRADLIDRQRIVYPQYGFDAIRGRAEANLGESGLGSGRLARQLRELEARRRGVEARFQREGGSANPFAARRAERELAAIDQQAAAIEASTIALKKFTDYLNRAAQEAQSNLESARQREEQTRREDLGRSTPRSRGARQRAEADLRRQEELNNRVQDEVAKARARLEEQASNPANPLSGTFARAREIDQLLAAGGLSSQEQAKLIEERRRLQDRIDRAINQEQSVIDARDASTREAERQQSELRGRGLMLRPGQQAALELDQQIADIMEAAAGRRARDPFGRQAAQINQDEQEAIRRVREDAMRQQAPAIFGLADAVTNALLQGPSRAALNPTDVSTVEGSRELTRLLRGDDAARDQANLVELQKEANRLLDLIANNPANIAN